MSLAVWTVGKVVQTWQPPWLTHRQTKLLALPELNLLQLSQIYRSYFSESPCSFQLVRQSAVQYSCRVFSVSIALVRRCCWTVCWHLNHRFYYLTHCRWSCSCPSTVSSAVCNKVCRLLRVRFTSHDLIAVASLGLVSPGAPATDRVTCCFFRKKPTTFY